MCLCNEVCGISWLMLAAVAESSVWACNMVGLTLILNWAQFYCLAEKRKSVSIMQLKQRKCDKPWLRGPAIGTWLAAAGGGYPPVCMRCCGMPPPNPSSCITSPTDCGCYTQVQSETCSIHHITIVTCYASYVQTPSVHYHITQFRHIQNFIQIT